MQDTVEYTDDIQLCLLNIVIISIFTTFQANVQYNKMPKNIVPEGQKPSFVLKVKGKPYKHDIDRCDRRTLEIAVG